LGISSCCPPVRFFPTNNSVFSVLENQRITDIPAVSPNVTLYRIDIYPYIIKNGEIMKILIADDSADFRERIRNLLDLNKKVEVVGEAANGVDALELIKNKEPDMIILDIRMPLMNGIQVLKEIKEQEIKITTCILTSFPHALYEKKCFNEGADYFFCKSKDFYKINLAIEKALANNGKG